MSRHMDMDGARKIPSVTTVISDMVPTHPGVVAWQRRLKMRGKDPSKELDRLAKIGTIVHYRILSEISTVKLEPPQFPFSEWPDNARMYADISKAMWDDWLFGADGVEISQPTCEFWFSNPVLGFCGTADLKCMINGELVIGDIKTSAAVRDTHELQISAYAKHFGARKAFLISVCPFIDKNPQLKYHVKWLDGSLLDERYSEFESYLIEWHEKFNGD